MQCCAVQYSMVKGDIYISHGFDHFFILRWCFAQCVPTVFSYTLQRCPHHYRYVSLT